MIASTALCDVIGGPPHKGRILGVSSHAVWVVVDDRVVVVSGTDGVRLPNAVVIAGVRLADEFVAGDGAIVLDGRRLLPSRWFDPTPVLPPIDREHLARALAHLAHVEHLAHVGHLSHVEHLARSIGDSPESRLHDALVRRAPVDLVDAAREHLGHGIGLTPSSDDVLVGAFSAFLHLGAALGDPQPRLLIDSVRPEVHRLATRATTTFSAALIDHALAGRVALPVARLLHALAGHGPLGDAVDELCAVGHSSGPALAAGVLVGASALQGGSM